MQQSGVDQHVIITPILAMIMATVVPPQSYFILRLQLGVADAAAIAATYGSISAVTFIYGSISAVTFIYGSISAVTFITATSLLTQLNISYGGHLVAAMALTESPAIIIDVFLYRESRCISLPRIASR